MPVGTLSNQRPREGTKRLRARPRDDSHEEREGGVHCEAPCCLVAVGLSLVAVGTLSFVLSVFSEATSFWD